MTGKTLYGFCNGYFGRDSYEDKVIEGEGKDWIVAREMHTGSVVFAVFEDEKEKRSCLSEWGQED
jgi:hypothetical protein